MRRPVMCSILLLLAAGSGCDRLGLDGSHGGDDAGQSPAPGDGWGSAPGTPVPGDAVPSAQSAAFSALKARVEQVESLDAEGALSAYPSGLETALSYDPLTSTNLDRIQDSALALNDGELSVLGEQGLVVSTRREFPTFLRGLAEIYSEHLPLYVSADSLLEAVHASYDAILLSLEQQVLLGDLKALLQGMRERLPAAAATAATKAEADVYLSVALSLLEGQAVAPVAGADPQVIADLVSGAMAAEGVADAVLFGVKRTVDFSQFKPRGHYTGEGPELEQYFRAMIWLGRIDLRLIETLPDGSQVFRPEQYQAMLLLHSLVGPDQERWQRIDDTVRTFVGESDSMVVPEVAALVTDLGGLDAAAKASDDAVVKAIVQGDYGAQEIMSHFMVNVGEVETLPLNRSFLLFGQRYVVDSHVFSEVVYDRIQDRMMPNPLDAAFAALGNNQALSLLEPELSEVKQLPGALSRMRVLVDAHEEPFWEANFYNLWLRALRALSPVGAEERAEGMPEIAQTEAFGRRVLNAQLGSWAELRHDTLLYAKQSYTGVPGCAFPDVYVDPYPEFFAALEKYAEQGERIVAIAQQAPDATLAARVGSYFDALASTSRTLGEMTQYQLRGEPFSEAQMAFINRSVRLVEEDAVCTVILRPDGWYADLFFNPDDTMEFDPTIADVHTQPADEAGNIVGRVLHAGTGYPRMMVVTIDTCEGPKAYAGVAYAYHEQITENFERLDDEQWSQRFGEGQPRPAEVPWLSPVLAAP